MPINTQNYSTYSNYGAITIRAASIATTVPVLSIAHLVDGPSFTFTGEENEKLIKLVLAPELDITAYENLLLSNMIIAIVVSPTLSPVEFMRFVRKHNLERHFKITVV